MGVMAIEKGTLKSRHILVIWETKVRIFFLFKQSEGLIRYS